VALRVSVTTLEQFRLYLSDVPYVTESDLQASIKGTTVWTPKMRLGGSGHCALENREPSHVLNGWHVCDDFRWSPLTMERIRPNYPTGGVSEIKGTREYKIGGDVVTLVGKGDHFIGTEQLEAKFTLSAFDPDRYIKSVQWKCYSLIFGPSAVTFVVFCCGLNDETNEVTVNETHNLTLYPYSGCEPEVVELLSRFVEYVRLRNLGSYLQPRAAA
jgi:hypothetical protein